MIIDIRKFILEGRSSWSELEEFLDRLASDPGFAPDLQQLARLQFLYQRTSADLARVKTFSSEPELVGYLEALVGRAYAEIHESHRRRLAGNPLTWFFRTFPETFRRNIGYFKTALIVTLIGIAAGVLFLAIDPEAREVLMPFPGLLQDPSERVADEESAGAAEQADRHATFAAQLMTHNIKVSVFAMAAGMTWGFLTVVLLFYNGVILGAVAFDYVRAGESLFLSGWLLPHGSIEIPSILIAGQAGLLLGVAMIGRRSPDRLGLRLRKILPDLVTLIGGVMILLVWAGLIEAFFSQYHYPLIPYEVKVLFGLVELLILAAFLKLGGGKRREGGSG